MQRYEREVNEILRALGCDIMPENPQMQENAAQSRESAGAHDWQTKRARQQRPAHRIAERVIAGSCLLLALALPLLLYGSVIAGLLVLLALVLLLVSLKYSRRSRHTDDDLTIRDLSWKDVTVRARPNTPGTTHNRDDSFWSM